MIPWLSSDLSQSTTAQLGGWQLERAGSQQQAQGERSWVLLASPNHQRHMGYAAAACAPQGLTRERNASLLVFVIKSFHCAVQKELFSH